MKRWMIGTAVLLSCWNTAGAQVLPGHGDLRDFQLTATAPPVSALKYQLLFDPSERRPENGAIYYFQAESLINQEFSQAVTDAEDAEEKNDPAKFDKLAEALDRPGVIRLMDFAGRCELYDRQLPLRQVGSSTLLPYLNAARQMANYLKVLAIYHIHKDNLPAAMAMIRLDLELGRNIGKDRVIVSGLVGQGIIALTMSEPITDLMNRPDAPNLYWALASLPRPLISLQETWGAERIALLGDAPQLAGSIDDLTGEQWRRIYDEIAVIPLRQTDSRNSAPNVEFEVVRTLPSAQEYYARTRNLPRDEVAKLNAFKLVATYWYEQFKIVSDDEYKLTALPYPQAIARMKEVNDEAMRMAREQPANVFLVHAGVKQVATTHARVDRMLAALTCVEAIRSYAAGHGGKFPMRLEEITQTPAPINPMTGNAFDYSVQGDTAVLADPDGDGLPMKYTIHLRGN